MYEKFYAHFQNTLTDLIPSSSFILLLHTLSSFTIIIITYLDLPSDAMMARFLPLLISGAFFTGIQMQRIAACFASTTILVQLAFYIWAVEFFLNFSLFFGSLAILSTNKDFAAKMKAKSRDPMITDTLYSQTIFWLLHCGSIVIGISLRMILNELRKRDKEAQRQKEALLRLDQDMPPFPITTAKSSAGSLGEVLRKEEAQKRLLQVRSWPRIVTGVNRVIMLSEVVYRLAFNRDSFLKFQCKLETDTICSLLLLFSPSSLGQHRDTYHFSHIFEFFISRVPLSGLHRGHGIPTDGTLRTLP